jgi:hypothetical protein
VIVSGEGGTVVIYDAKSWEQKYKLDKAGGGVLLAANPS